MGIFLGSLKLTVLLIDRYKGELLFEISIILILEHCAPVAQLDRVLDFESIQRGLLIHQ